MRNDTAAPALSRHDMLTEGKESAGRSVARPRWTIIVEELVVETHVGMYSHEYGKPQKIVIDATLQYEQPPVEADSAGLIDYDGWCSVIEAYLSTKAHTRLLETLAADIARLSFQRWPSVASITLSLHKPKIRTNARRLGIALQLRREDIVEDD